MGNIPIKTILERSKEPGYFPNYYDILDQTRFSIYDSSRKLKRIEENRREVLDKDDQTALSKLILEADKILKNPKSKSQYDPRLTQYLDKLEGQRSIALSYGYPKILIECPDIGENKRLVVSGIKPGAKKQATLRVFNSANTGTLSVSIDYLPKGQWLHVDRNSVNQNELHKPITVTVLSDPRSFEGKESQFGVINFTYKTDDGLKKYSLGVEASILSQKKKKKKKKNNNEKEATKNLVSIVSSVATLLFSVSYGLIVLFLLSEVFLENGLFTKLVLLASIGALAHTLYAINSTDESHESPFDLINHVVLMFSLIGLIFLAFVSFKIVLLFIISLIIISIIKFIERENESSLYAILTPLLGVGAFYLILSTTPAFNDAIFGVSSNPEETQSLNSSMPNTVLKVFLSTDVNLRDKPSSKDSEIIGLGKTGQKYEIVEARPNSSWKKVKIGSKVGYLYVPETNGVIVEE